MSSKGHKYLGKDLMIEGCAFPPFLNKFFLAGKALFLTLSKHISYYQKFTN
jgi:hypothetical protein